MLNGIRNGLKRCFGLSHSAKEVIDVDEPESRPPSPKRPCLAEIPSSSTQATLERGRAAPAPPTVTKNAQTSNKISDRPPPNTANPPIPSQPKINTHQRQLTISSTTTTSSSTGAHIAHTTSSASSPSTEQKSNSIARESTNDPVRTPPCASRMIQDENGRDVAPPPLVPPSSARFPSNCSSYPPALVDTDSDAGDDDRSVISINSSSSHAVLTDEDLFGRITPPPIKISLDDSIAWEEGTNDSFSIISISSSIGPMTEVASQPAPHHAYANHTTQLFPQQGAPQHQARPGANEFRDYRDSNFPPGPPPPSPYHRTDHYGQVLLPHGYPLRGFYPPPMATNVDVHQFEQFQGPYDRDDHHYRRHSSLTHRSRRSHRDNREGRYRDDRRHSSYSRASYSSDEDDWSEYGSRDEYSY